jgi:hypothetical protein
MPGTEWEDKELGIKSKEDPTEMTGLSQVTQNPCCVDVR